MADTVPGSLLLLQLACVIVVVAHLLARKRVFAEVLDDRISVRTRLILTLVSGALSVYGTVGGVEVVGGAIVTVRDPDPMVAKARSLPAGASSGPSGRSRATLPRPTTS